MDASNEGTEFLLASSDAVLCGLYDDGADVNDESEFNTAGLTMAQKSIILKDPNVRLRRTCHLHIPSF